MPVSGYTRYNSRPRRRTARIHLQDRQHIARNHSASSRSLRRVSNRSDICVLYLNAGGVRHTGPNRMWVESARRWAERGVVSLRIDLQGIGESEGQRFPRSSGFISRLKSGGAGRDCDRFPATARRSEAVWLVAGLCSGACWAFHAAVRYSDVQAAILVNPSLLYWDPGVDRRRILPRFGDGFSGWTDWARMVGSGIRRAGPGRAAHLIAERLYRAGLTGSAYVQMGTRTLEQTWAALERAQKKVTLVFRDGEPLLAELERQPAGLPAEGQYVRAMHSGSKWRGILLPAALGTAAAA